MNSQLSFTDALAKLTGRVGPGASARGVVQAAKNTRKRKGTLVGDVLGMFKRDPSGVKFRASRGQRVNDVRSFRRSLGWLSGRQWRKLRKALRAEERAA